MRWPGSIMSIQNSTEIPYSIRQQSKTSTDRREVTYARPASLSYGESEQVNPLLRQARLHGCMLINRARWTYPPYKPLEKNLPWLSCQCSRITKVLPEIFKIFYSYNTLSVEEFWFIKRSLYDTSIKMEHARGSFLYVYMHRLLFS